VRTRTEREGESATSEAGQFRCDLSPGSIQAHFPRSICVPNLLTRRPAVSLCPYTVHSVPLTQCPAAPDRCFVCHSARSRPLQRLHSKATPTWPSTCSGSPTPHVTRSTLTCQTDHLLAILAVNPHSIQSLPATHLTPEPGVRTSALPASVQALGAEDAQTYLAWLGAVSPAHVHVIRQAGREGRAWLPSHWSRDLVPALIRKERVPRGVRRAASSS
jgi:hypothetical protein